MPKSKKSDDPLDKIWGLVKSKTNNPNYGITEKRGRYWLIFYNKNWISNEMDLRTDDIVEARKLRDQIHFQVRARGRGARSKLGHYAQCILKDPSTNHGLKYMVYFGGRTVACGSLAEARQERERIAKEILEREEAA